MSRKEDYEERTWKLLLPVLEELHLIPVDVEFVKEGGEYYLRCYIDKEGGVGINDCEQVSRRIDPVLDREDFITEAYTLEVSSPGLGRPLKRPRDFEYAAGRMVELKTFQAVEGKKERSGILRGWDKDSVTVESEDGTMTTIPRKSLALIRLAFED